MSEALRRPDVAVPPWQPLTARQRRHRRTSAPAWIKGLHDIREHDEVDYAWGEQAEWGWALPWLWAQLRDPRTPLRAPATPTEGMEPWTAGAYWVPAIHLMRYGLGWSRLDQGLAAWLMADRPKTSPALRLLDEVWARDGQLEWLMAWLGRAALGAPSDGLVEPGLPPTVLDWTPFDPWIERIQLAAHSSGVTNPIAGGGDNLHLSGHTSGPAVEPRPDSARLCDSTRPALVVDGGVGWYRSLEELTYSLTFNNVEVDVVSLSLGWIGRFTRSADTGRWYLANTDTHWHAAGN